MQLAGCCRDALDFVIIFEFLFNLPFFFGFEEAVGCSVAIVCITMQTQLPYPANRFVIKHLKLHFLLKIKKNQY